MSVAFRFCFNILTIAVACSAILTINEEEAREVLQLGKVKYGELLEKTELPRYGLCWKNAVKFLESGCKHLNEDVHRNIALKLTDCFLEMSGHETYSCSDKPYWEKLCLQRMTDRAFNVYTEFYTHTQNVCFYIQSHIWHEETENTISRLTDSSAHVLAQLDIAANIQTELLRHQKYSMLVQRQNMDMQRKLLHHGAVLKETIEESRKSVFEMRSILFDRLSEIQNWVIGEISWLNTVIFYLTSLIVVYVSTATPRTAGGRIWLIVILTVNVLIERGLYYYFTNDSDSLIAVSVVNSNISWWVSVDRKLVVITCIIILCKFAYNYIDYNVVNNSLLREIQELNVKVLQFLEQRYFEESTPVKLTAENNVLSKNKHAPTQKLNDLYNNMNISRNGKELTAKNCSLFSSEERIGSVSKSFSRGRIMLEKLNNGINVSTSEINSTSQNHASEVSACTRTRSSIRRTRNSNL